MKQKAPNCLHGHGKMRKTYCLISSAGKKRWVPVGWTCPVCGMLEIDKKDFPETGHGLPGAPMCNSCKKPMKALYSQVEGKNQMRRIKGSYACFSRIHEVRTIPKQLTDIERVVTEGLREVIQNHGKEIMYEWYGKIYGIERANEIRRVESQRTIHGMMMEAWSLSEISAHMGRVVFSDGTVGEFVFPPELWRFSLQVRKDPPWDIIEKHLGEIGVKMKERDKTRNPEPYINTAILYEWVCEHTPEMINAVGLVLIHLLTPSHALANASVLYGTMVAYSFFKEANNESIDVEERESAERIFVELLNYGFNIRVLNSEHYFLKNLRRQIPDSRKK